MPCQHVIDPEARLVYVHLHGAVTGSEINAVYRAYLEDPAWEPTYRVLWDGRSLQALIVEWDEMARFRGEAADLEEHVGAGRTAIVVMRDVDLTMAKNYTLFQARDLRRAKGRETIIVREMPAAAEYLDVPVAEIGRIRERLVG